MRCAQLLIILSAALWGCNGQDTPSIEPPTSLHVSVVSKPWDHPYGRGKLLVTKHYRVFASTDNSVLLANLPGMLEAAYKNYTRLTSLDGATTGGRMAVYMLASRQQWVGLTKQVFGPDSIALSIRAGGYAHKGIGVYWDLRGRATLQVAVHEGLHQFLYHRLRHRLPVFIEEGLATNAEGFHISGDTVRFTPSQNPVRIGSLLRVLTNDRWMPAAKLMEAESGAALPDNERLGWYAQIWALTLFLRSDATYSRGLDAMIQGAREGSFHKALKDNPTMARRLRRRGTTHAKLFARPLFEYYITADMPTFEAQYRNFALKLTGLPTR